MDCSLEILSRQKAGATVGSSCSFLRCHAHGYIRALLRKNTLKGTSRTLPIDQKLEESGHTVKDGRPLVSAVDKQSLGNIERCSHVKSKSR